MIIKEYLNGHEYSYNSETQTLTIGDFDLGIQLDKENIIKLLTMFKLIDDNNLLFLKEG